MTGKKNERQATGLQLAKDSNSELMKTYFTKVFELKQSGKEFPINLDEVFPLIYERKDHAIRALKSDFVENEDYILQSAENQFFPKNGEQKKRGGHNRLDYFLSVECLEYFIAKKVKPVFEVYRSVFHKTVEAKEQTRKISESGSYTENQLFLTKLGTKTIKGIYLNGELWYSLSTISKFLGYETSLGVIYAKKYGQNNSRNIQDGKVSLWVVNIVWLDEYLKSTQRDIPYEKITTLYRDLFKIEKSPSVDTPYTYHYTDKEVLSIINELNKFKAKPSVTQIIIDLLMQGGGR